MGGLTPEQIRAAIDRNPDGSARLLYEVFVGRKGIRYDPTPAELGCLRAASVGLDAHESGVVLGIGHETVKSHLANARRKLRAKNTCHAVALAIRASLI